MDKKKLMLLLGAMVVAIGTALAARSMLSGATAPAVQAAMPIIAPKGPRVLVAQRALPPGTIITADAIGFQEWPGNMVRDAYFVDGKVNMNKLIGTVVRFPITAGQPLTNGALVAPGDRGFLAAALAPGMRAITITVSEKSGVAGFIFPGDHVDVMLTQTVKGSGMDSQGLSATETVLRNIRVLATDQSTETESANGKTLVHTFHTVTVEVTPKIAEKVEVAQAIGALSLTLRPLADNQAELDRAIASGSVKLGDGARSAGPSEAQMLAAARSPMDGGSTMTTGGEVSRFQPKRMPMGGAVAAAPAMPGQPSQPHFANGVRVTRGSSTVTVDPSAASQAGAFNAALAGGVGNAGQAVGSINPATAALR
ncbi:MAG TPA: Flp pilus assembly protein CpaB [Novosphingobium sp.]|nr:Flp pilus assembly protein CpaB [Novosphingobium sp.]